MTRILRTGLVLVGMLAALPALAAKDGVTLGMTLEPPTLDPTTAPAAAIGQVVHYNLFEGLTRIRAYDGREAWQVNPFAGRKDPERLSADDARDLAEDAADFLGALIDYREKGYTLDYLGLEDVDGTEAHKLRVTRPNGDVTYVYLDPDYFLEVRAVNRRIEHGVPHETVIDYGDAHSPVVLARFCLGSGKYFLRVLQG